VTDQRTTQAKGLGGDWRKACEIAKRIHPWVCCYCHHPIERNPDRYKDRWSGDHEDPRCLAGTTIPEPRYIRPAHVSCNAQAGARLRAQLTGHSNSTPLTTSRRW
jgi:hypothetical protein